MAASIKDKETELLQTLQAYHNHTEMTRYLISRGRALSCLPDEGKRPEDLVEGCLSKLWLRAELRDGRLYLQLAGDSSLVLGLGSLLLALYDGEPPASILAHPLHLFDSPLLQRLVPQSKRSGLSYLQHKILAEAAQAQALSPPGPG